MQTPGAGGGGYWCAGPGSRARGSTRRRPGRCGPSRGRLSSRRPAARCCGSPPSAGRFGIVPSRGLGRRRSLDRADRLERVEPGRARAGDRRASTAARDRAGALHLLADLRRAATPPASCPSASTRAPACRARRRRSPGPTPSRPRPASSSGPDAASSAAAAGAIRPAERFSILAAMEARAARSEDCEAIARGMKVVVDEGGWLATEPSTAGRGPRGALPGRRRVGRPPPLRARGRGRAGRRARPAPVAGRRRALARDVDPAALARARRRPAADGGRARRPAPRCPQGRARGLPRQRRRDRPLPLVRLRAGGPAARPLPPRRRLACARRCSWRGSSWTEAAALVRRRSVAEGEPDGLLGVSATVTPGPPSISPTPETLQLRRAIDRSGPGCGRGRSPTSVPHSPPIAIAASPRGDHGEVARLADPGRDDVGAVRVRLLRLETPGTIPITVAAGPRRAPRRRLHHPRRRRRRPPSPPPRPATARPPPPAAQLRACSRPLLPITAT